MMYQYRKRVSRVRSAVQFGSWFGKVQFGSGFGSWTQSSSGFVRGSNGNRIRFQ